MHKVLRGMGERVSIISLREKKKKNIVIRTLIYLTHNHNNNFNTHERVGSTSYEWVH